MFLYKKVSVEFLEEMYDRITTKKFETHADYIESLYEKLIYSDIQNENSSVLKYISFILIVEKSNGISW